MDDADDSQLITLSLQMIKETSDDVTLKFRQLGEISITDLENP
jgi:hypothetical protein